MLLCPSRSCTLRGANAAPARSKPLAPALGQGPVRHPAVHLSKVNRQNLVDQAADQRVCCRAATVETPPPQAGASKPVMPPPGDFSQAIAMQGFGWDSCQKGGWYKKLQASIPDLQDLGITHLWLPPPSQSVSPQGYMPGQLYNLNSSYGKKEELIELTSALNAAGIKPVADIVINHRCADEQVNGVWNKYHDDVTHEGKRIDWGKWAITSNDPTFQGTGNPDTGDDYGPAPDLDHTNEELRSALKDWLNWLKDGVGFKGWRLDFVRGYGAQYVKEYISATTTGQELNIGEYWTDLQWEDSNLAANQDAARQRLVDWVNASGKVSAAFDFPTKGILQEAVKKTQYWRLKDGQGKAPGLIGWLPSRAVTFIDNHDTGSTQNHWPFPSDKISSGYAYILTHPGIPCLFWDHYMTWGADLKQVIAQLVALRHRTGINSRSQLSIQCAEADMYVANIDDRLILKLGPRYDMGKHLPSEKQGWKFALSGKDWAVWEKAA